jgi:hypothetical protein
MIVQTARRGNPPTTAPHGVTESKMKVNVGKGIELDINETTLPKAAIDHVVMIGLRNILMDSHASITADEYPGEAERKAAAEAMVAKKLDALMRGEVRVASSREGDPVRAEALRSATAVIIAALKKAGTIKKAADIDAKLLREKAGELVAKKPEFMEKARETVEARKSATVDLADIGL